MPVRGYPPWIRTWSRIRSIWAVVRLRLWDNAQLLAKEEENTTSAANEQIYCLKCRGRTNTLKAEEVVLRNGRSAVTGQCAVCGTKKFRMGGARK